MDRAILRTTAALAVSTLTATAAIAQGRHDFAVDPSSTFKFVGGIGIPAIGLSGMIEDQSPAKGGFGVVSTDIGFVDEQPSFGALVHGTGATVLFPPQQGVVRLDDQTSVTVTFQDVVLEVESSVDGVPVQFPISQGRFATEITVRAANGQLRLEGAYSAVITLSKASTLPGSGVVRVTADGLELDLGLEWECVGSSQGVNWDVLLRADLVAKSLPFAADTTALPIELGGTQSMTLTTGAKHKNQSYLVLSTLSGTGPGIQLPSGHVLPLAHDAFLEASFVHANAGPWGNTLGKLDGLGIAHATFTLPPIPIFAGSSLRVHHAYVVFEDLPTQKILTTSNPISLSL